MTHGKVDLRELASVADVDLEAALKGLASLYDEIDERNEKNTAELELPCMLGCDACCHESVFLTPLEFFAVWDFVQRRLEDAARDRIIEEGLRLYEENRDLIVALEEDPPEGAKDHLEVARQIKFRCPFLGEQGGCCVYPVRELYARMFGYSFNDDDGIYGCDLVGEHLAGREVSLLRVRSTARRLDELPLTGKRQVYPYYIHLLYG